MVIDPVGREIPQLLSKLLNHEKSVERDV